MPRATNAPASRERRKRVLKKSQRLSRPPFETFPLRQRRDHEGPVLGLSRPQNAQTQFPLSLDSAPQRRRPRQWPDLQPFRRRLKAAGIGLDRKILADLAVTDEDRFQIDRRSGQRARSRRNRKRRKGGVRFVDVVEALNRCSDSLQRLNSFNASTFRHVSSTRRIARRRAARNRRGA